MAGPGPQAGRNLGTCTTPRRSREGPLREGTLASGPGEDFGFKPKCDHHPHPRTTLVCLKLCCGQRQRKGHKGHQEAKQSGASGWAGVRSYWEHVLTLGCEAKTRGDNSSFGQSFALDGDQVLDHVGQTWGRKVVGPGGSEVCWVLVVCHGTWTAQRK